MDKNSLAFEVSGFYFKFTNSLCIFKYLRSDGRSEEERWEGGSFPKPYNINVKCQHYCKIQTSQPSLLISCGCLFTLILLISYSYLTFYSISPSCSPSALLSFLLLSFRGLHSARRLSCLALMIFYFNCGQDVSTLVCSLIHDAFSLPLSSCFSMFMPDIILFPFWL